MLFTSLLPAAKFFGRLASTNYCLSVSSQVVVPTSTPVSNSSLISNVNNLLVHSRQLRLSSFASQKQTPSPSLTEQQDAPVDKDNVNKFTQQAHTSAPGADKPLVKGEEESESDLQIYEIPNDLNPLAPKKHVFQELKRSQHPDPVYTMEEAAEYRTIENIHTYWKYPRLSQMHADTEYALRSTDNEYSIITHFPEVTDFVIVGSGLVGSGVAYYIKKRVSRMGDVVVFDKDPYSSHNNTALCNGLISSHSKVQDISRIAALSKELIRNLRNDLLVTNEDFASIKYRPVTHLILWPENEVEEVVNSLSWQVEDGVITDAKQPHELEATFPWLKAVETDIALGTHGNQDEALVDPIALRNLYRTLAQGYGANFIKAEIIDFNTLYSLTLNEISSLGAAGIVARIPDTGELRHCSFAKVLLSLGHNTPFLEARSDMEKYMRDQIDDLHFIQPKFKAFFTFQSMAAPVINFPVITDTDGSILIKENYSGGFKYYLNYEESEKILDMDYDMFVKLDSDETYPNLIHKSKMFENYFYDVIKPRLVKRIPIMEDATFIVAHTGFESCNTHDKSPVICPHPFHTKVSMAAGYGPRMMTFGPCVAAAMSELMIDDEETTFDLTNFYWNRVIRGRMINEFPSLLQ